MSGVMLSFTSKRDVDRHIGQMCQKLNEYERSSRGYALAKMYAKIQEYELAKDWLQRYLEIIPDNAAAHKFMGEIYENLNKPEKAIVSFQRSYNLNSNQGGIIKNVCRLMLQENIWQSSPARARFWCNLAEAENIQDDNITNLSLKLINNNKKQGTTEEMVQREIFTNPHNVRCRIKMVNLLLVENRISEALQYCFHIEMKFIEAFVSSIDWYSTIMIVLKEAKYNLWNYWYLRLITADKLAYLHLKKDSKNPNYFKDATKCIFEFDQILNEAADQLVPVSKELGEELVNHYRGQLSLHISSLLLQKQNNQLQFLPFLIFASQCGTVNTEASYFKNFNTTAQYLLKRLKIEGAFRCVQATRTLLSYKKWLKIDEIFNQIREICGFFDWRKCFYRQLFASPAYQSKFSTSYFLRNPFFQEPVYKIFSPNDIENFEIISQHLYPSSLEHQVYLGLGRQDLHTFRTQVFNQLDFSTENLYNCNPETINKIDVGSFLFCAIIEARSSMEAGMKSFERFNNGDCIKPFILPAANIINGLCTKEQSQWWSAAYKIHKDCSYENIEQYNTILKPGIEAVRGINDPKIDLIILLKLGEALMTCSNSINFDENKHLKLRAEHIFKFAMEMVKNGDTSTVQKFFKFNTNNYDTESELEQLTAEAIGFLSSVYFKRNQYKEFINEFAGIQNYMANLLRHEAYKKLGELDFFAESQDNYEIFYDCYGDSFFRNQNDATISNNSDDHVGVDGLVQNLNNLITSIKYDIQNVRGNADNDVMITKALSNILKSVENLTQSIRQIMNKIPKNTEPDDDLHVEKGETISKNMAMEKENNERSRSLAASSKLQQSDKMLNDLVKGSKNEKTASKSVFEHSNIPNNGEKSAEQNEPNSLADLKAQDSHKDTSSSQTGQKLANSELTDDSVVLNVDNNQKCANLSQNDQKSADVEIPSDSVILNSENSQKGTNLESQEKQNVSIVSDQPKSRRGTSSSQNDKMLVEQTENSGIQHSDALQAEEKEQKDDKEDKYGQYEEEEDLFEDDAKLPNEKGQPDIRIKIIKKGKEYLVNIDYKSEESPTNYKITTDMEVSQRSRTCTLNCSDGESIFIYFKNVRQSEIFKKYFDEVREKA